MTVATSSSIEWTEATWNPVVGCTIISPGCTNCYAMRLTARLAAMGSEKYAGLTRVSGGRAKWNGVMRLDAGSLDLPRTWRDGRLVFVNSMSDLFHDQVEEEWITRVFGVMAATPRHTYQVLTKRPERTAALNRQLSWPDHIWMGTSVENNDYVERIDWLRQTSAAVKFLSLEPLLGPLDDLDLTGIDWVIVGGESGPGARPMDSAWVRSIRDQCVEQNVAFHFKQWGGANKKKTGRVLDGRTWDQLPSRKGTSQPNSQPALF
jgi:protein gp37